MANFQTDPLSVQNFWDLVKLFQSLEDTKAYAQTIQDVSKQIAIDLKTQAAAQAGLDEYQSKLDQLAKDLNEAKFNLDSAKAAWENSKLKQLAEIKGLADSLDATKRALADQANELDARTRSLDTRAVDLEAFYIKRTDELSDKEEKLNDREAALSAKEDTFELKQKALQAALKGV